MKFIFPQNYTFKNKIFGFIDYSVAIINLVWVIMIGGLLHICIKDINIKVIVFIILCFQVFLLSIYGILKQKLFFYAKTNKYR